jgi:hypothetical protein
VEAEDLAAAMRRAYEDRAAAAAVGARASAHMHAEHTWERSAAVAAARLTTLAGRTRAAA